MKPISVPHTTPGFILHMPMCTFKRYKLFKCAFKTKCQSA